MLGSNRVRQEIAPSEGYEESLPVVKLVGERATEQRYLAQAQKNEATLIVLDKQWRELPADLPHMQARITEERREHLNLLTDAEKGPTVLLKLTEVFMLRLGIAKPGLGYGWVSDRPAAMALLETDGSVYVTAPAASWPRPAVVTVRRNARVLAVPKNYGSYGGVGWRCGT